MSARSMIKGRVVVWDTQRWRYEDTGGIYHGVWWLKLLRVLGL